MDLGLAWAKKPYKKGPYIGLGLGMGVAIGIPLGIALGNIDLRYCTWYGNWIGFRYNLGCTADFEYLWHPQVLKQ